MKEADVAALLVVLFALLYLFSKIGIVLALDRLTLSRNLRSGANAKTASPDTLLARSGVPFGKVYTHLADRMAALGWRIGPDRFVRISCALGIFGAMAGYALFQTPRSSLLLGAVLAITPYAILGMRMVNRQMATRLEFLPAVELFYQCYLVTGCRHIRTALQKTVEERRLPTEVQFVFEQLYRNLAVRENDESSLRRFALSFGHRWAEYFVSILKVALSEGNNVAENLKELISDMRKAQLEDHLERNRLLEIRIANFTPAVFLALFLFINFRLNPEGSYRYYFLDAGGRSMLLNAVVLLFGSLMMGLYLSKRKM